MQPVRKRILLVDDEEDVRLFLKDFIAERDYEVEDVGTGDEALARIAKNKPDLVLLDLMLPGMDGLTCLEKIKQIDPKIAVIMITAYKDDEKIKRAQKLGVQNYIAKPFSLSYLENELAKLLPGQSS